MNRVNTVLINILSSSINCSPSSIMELEPQEWQQLYEEAIAHQVHLIIFEEANKYGRSVNPELFERWRKYTIVEVLGHQGKIRIIKELSKAFEEANIPVIALKGLIFKHLYPKPELRTMGDIDIFIRRDSLHDAIRVIKNFGYEKIPNDDPKHYTFSHKQYILIELHVSLVTESRRKLATSLNNDIWESLICYNSDGISFLVPNDINHLLYCCIHMSNHFGKGGFGLRQLSDFSLLVRRLGTEVDWNKIIERAYRYGIGMFLKSLLCVCHKLFSVEVPNHIIEEFEGSADDIDKFIQAILDSGVFGGKKSKELADRVLATYIYNDKRNRIMSCKYLFPKRETLDKKYQYAKKYPILLPIAWVHRLFRNIFISNLDLKDRIPNPKKINEYVKLFKWLDIK